MSERNELVRRVERAERALRWYANPKNWSDDTWGIPSVVHPPEYGYPGEKARRALGMPSQRKKAAHV